MINLRVWVVLMDGIRAELDRGLMLTFFNLEVEL